MNSIKHLIVIALFTASSTAYAAFSQIISFGDSLSDTGNILAASSGTLPIAPYLPGRFSNGTTWNENLATELGLAAPTASLTGGTNFAWGGSRTSLPGSTGQPSAQDQVGQHLLSTGGVADPNALYTILIGGNDVNAFDGVGYGIPELSADGQLVAALAGQLLAAGAQNILVMNVPDLGGAPIADGNESGATALTQAFNANLAGALAALASPNVAFVDAFTISQDIAANPALFGLTNVDDPCFDGVSVCANPNEYLFWDDLHPTARGHQLISDAALIAANTLPSAIPVPAAFPLFLSAIAALGWARGKTA